MKIRFSFMLTAAILTVAVGTARAQVAAQHITFSLLGEYQTNFAFPNPDDATFTNDASHIRSILVSGFNVVKAIAVDLNGTNFATNWGGSILLREVNLTNGHEGIFLRKNGLQTNVSSFFGGSFSNNFTALLTNSVPGLTNNFTPQLELSRTYVNTTGSNASTTNFSSTAGLHFLSFNSTNLKFNLVAVGNGGISNFVASAGGVVYSNVITYQLCGTAGDFYLQTDTNLFDLGTNPPPSFVTGPMRGAFNVGFPYFLNIPGP